LVKKGRKKAKTAVKRHKGPRKLTAARVRKLALESDDITGADAEIGRLWDLPGQLRAYPELEAAWRRGRLLRNLRRLAGVGATRHEAAHDLELPLAAFDELVTNDLEAAEIWNAGKLETAIRVKESLLANAEAGKAQAIKQLENVLRSEIAHAQFDPRRVPEPLVCEIFGVTRQTLHLWRRDKGCPRNAADTTYDLPAMVRWYEGFVRGKAGIDTPAAVNPLQAVKAERLALELQHRRGELVSLAEVRAGWLVRERAMVSLLERLPEQYGPALAGQTKQQIVAQLKDLADDLRREFVTRVEEATAENL